MRIVNEPTAPRVNNERQLPGQNARLAALPPAYIQPGAYQGLNGRTVRVIPPQPGGGTIAAVLTPMPQLQPRDMRVVAPRQGTVVTPGSHVVPGQRRGH